MSESIDKLRVVIFTAPQQINESITLAKDIELVRASMLYADEVELVSVGAVLLYSKMILASDPQAFMEILAEQGADSDFFHLKGVTIPRDLRDLLSVHSVFMEEEIQEAVRASGVGDLIPAIDAGILSLSTPDVPNGSSFEELAIGWIELLMLLLQDVKKRFLLDDQVGGLVRSMVDRNLVSLGKLPDRHSKEAAVGSGLLVRLPAFPQARTDELLDVRKDLNEPLIRYRSAVSRLAGKLSARSFDLETQPEIDDIWRNDVYPALIEIEAGFAEHRLVRELLRTIGGDLKTVATLGSGAGIYLALDQFSAISNWLAAAGGMLGAAAQGLATAASKRHESTTKVKQNELYYLYATKRAIS